MLEQMGNSVALSGDRPAHQVLENCVPRCHDAAGSKVLQNLPQYVNRLHRTHGDPSRLVFQVMLRGLTTAGVIEKVQDNLLLFEADGLR